MENTEECKSGSKARAEKIALAATISPNFLVLEFLRVLCVLSASVSGASFMVQR